MYYYILWLHFNLNQIIHPTLWKNYSLLHCYSYHLRALAKRLITLTQLNQKTETSIKTSDTAIYKGIKYPVYKSKNNKYYILVTAKTSGKPYKKYITDEIKN